MRRSGRGRGFALVVVVGLVATVWVAGPAAAAGENILASHAAGLPANAGNSFSEDPSISADGRFVAFQSEATDLVPGMTNANGTGDDIYLFDRSLGTVTLVSHIPSSATTTGNDSSFDPVISADGAFVVFESPATNLVTSTTTDDQNGTGIDVFLWERATGAVTLVSHVPGSATVTGEDTSQLHENPGYPVISADGAFVVFESFADNLVTLQDDQNSGGRDVFLFSRATGSLTLVSHTLLATTTGNGRSFKALISADGKWVTYMSEATDLVAGTDTNGDGSDVFLYESFFLVGGINTLVSHIPGMATTSGNDRSQDPTGISSDGSFVVFESDATDLVAGSDLNTETDAFLFTRASGTVTLVSHVPGDPTTAGDGESDDPVITADGAYVAFESNATDLTGSDGNGSTSDVFLFARTGGAVTLVSHTAGSATTTGNGGSFDAYFSADGRFLVFESFATDLIVGTDGNSEKDVFRFTRATGTNALVSHIPGDPTTTSNDTAEDAFPSANGSVIAFEGNGTNLVPGQVDAGDDEDIFVSVSPADCAAPPPATITGTNNNEILTGTPGPDVIDGKGGRDQIFGAGGDDVIIGGDGDDVLVGGDGDDTLCGGNGRDSLRGADGEDRLFGEAGNDTLRGEGGAGDLCDGGPGSDSLPPGHGCESFAGLP